MRYTMMIMNGMLLINKPSGWTSFDVVNYVRKIVAQAEAKKPKHVKVGHIGTLDPLATGLLVLLIGRDYTRRAQELSKQDKRYEVTLRLGLTSTTGDEEGEKAIISSIEPSEAVLKQAFAGFVGTIMQTPPIYSAIKVNGVRAYNLARQGKEIALQPRPVTIYHAEITDYSYPYAQFVVEVSSGTYIRSLVTDLGAMLMTGAYMTALRRTRIGDFSLDDAVEIEGLSEAVLTSALRTNS
jgi:tRNA pseudouridine55 synthase